MKRTTLFITGTDTAVGKTVLAALLTRHLRNRGICVAALKPVCAGGRDDAHALSDALGGTLTLDEINPWHFRAPLAPILAAHRQGERVTPMEVLSHVRSIRKHSEVVLVEGAGGLLSPLGEDFNSLDLVTALRAAPIVVCPNRLGAVNQVLLTLAALPRAASRRTSVVLMSPQRPDPATRSNSKLLAECLGDVPIFTLPWLGNIRRPEVALTHRRVVRTLDALMARARDAGSPLKEPVSQRRFSG